jgi:ABC-type glycerol-3-phosphate transport system substrate-binding protein
MKKLLSVSALLLVLVFALTACRGDESAGGIREDGTLYGTLRIWSFTNEAQIIATAFKGLHPDVEIDFQMVSMDGGQYQEWVSTALAVGGSDVPDIVLMEADFVRAFVLEEGMLADITHLNRYAAGLETIPFTIQAGTDNAGVIRAFSYQAAPGAMFFRRSMAIRYFGTDDPDQLQHHFRDMDTFVESARHMRDMSGGSTRIVSGPTEVLRAFLPNRQQPWVVNNRLHIDPLMYQYLDMAYILRNEGLDAEIGQWWDEWFDSMRDQLTDAAGNPIHVFSYFVPTWGLPFVILPNAGEYTEGDWGIIPGPLPYQWGGTWLAVTAQANNPDVAQEFVRFAALDETHLTNWATGVYTNEFLRAIDPSVPAGLAQGAGDLVSSARLIRELAHLQYNTPSSNFIGGQNPYTIFGEAAMAVSFGLQQGTDASIQNAFDDAVGLYITGEATRAEALESFRNDVGIAVPGLDW